MGEGEDEGAAEPTAAEEKLRMLLLGPITRRVNNVDPDGRSFAFGFDAFRLMPSEDWPSDHAAVVTALEEL